MKLGEQVRQMLRQLDPKKKIFQLESDIFFNIDADIIRKHRKSLYYNRRNSDYKWIN